MNETRSAKLAFRLALISPALTLVLWGWILTRPHGTFNDQGGMMISFIYFPVAFLAWLLFGIPGLVMAIRSWRRTELIHKRLACAAIALSILGLLLAFATLVIA